MAETSINADNVEDGYDEYGEDFENEENQDEDAGAGEFYKIDDQNNQRGSERVQEPAKK